MFDENTFLDTGYTQAGSTQPPRCPPANYTAAIADVKARSVNTADGPRWVCDVTYRVEGLDVPPVRHDSIWLDLTPDGQALDMSAYKNTALNRLREAAGQNVQGQQWTPRQLIGAHVGIKVEPDRKNPQYVRVYEVWSAQQAQAPQTHQVAPGGNAGFGAVPTQGPGPFGAPGGPQGPQNPFSPSGGGPQRWS